MNIRLCPNDLILGRASQRVPAGPWNESKKIAKIFFFIQGTIDDFWNKWTLCYFPSLLLQQKWHHDKRNIRVGDIVLISDNMLKRGDWRMGKVTRVVPGIDHKVRCVTVRYKNNDSNQYTEIERPVQRLIVILPVDEY